MSLVLQLANGLVVVAVLVFTFYWGRAMIEAIRTPSSTYEATGSSKVRWLLALIVFQIYAPYRWHHSGPRRASRSSV